MRKKILALILILPLLLMFTIFSVTSVVGIAIDVPVGGVLITNETEDGVIAFDMATYNNDFYLSVEVTPYQASNKTYSVDLSAIGDEEMADIEIDSVTGLLKLNGCGKVKVTVVMNDGAFKDSVIFIVTSTKVLDFTPVISSSARILCPLSSGTATDYTVTTASGKYNFNADFTPSTLSASDVSWASSDENLLSINQTTGRATLKLSGSVTVTATVENGLYGQIIKTILVNITQTYTDSGITVNGEDNATLLMLPTANQTTFAVEKDISEGDIILGGTDIAYVSSFELTPTDLSGLRFLATIHLKSYLVKPENLSLSLSIEGSVRESYDLTISFKNYVFEVLNSYIAYGLNETVYQKNNTSVGYVIVSTPENNNLTYVWSTDDSSVLSCSQNSNSALCKLNALKTGTVTLTVTPYENGTALTDYVVTRTVHVVASCTSLVFIENTYTYGIGNQLAVANKEIIDTSITGYEYPLQLKTYLNTASTFDISNLISVTSSDNDLAEINVIDNKAYLIIKGTGEVIITGEWVLNGYFGQSVTANLILTVVDGVNVQDYGGLKFAASAGEKIVLTKNIDLGEQLFNVTYDGNGNIASKTAKYSDEVMASKLQSEVSQIATTFDWTFYKNQGLSQPTVNYCMEFKNNVYGNGYILNADNITQMLDDTGNLYPYAVFKGPLDFVAISSAAVKAQDNIVFLVKTDGVVIDNVVLKGCSDNSLYNDGNLDLTLLNYTGTTLEIMSNASIINSRVNNGRTVLRAYGKADIDNTTAVSATDEKITVNIESCILSSAREFILKVGTNRFIVGDRNTEISPYLTREGGGNYTSGDDANLNDSYFLNNYLLTDVTLKNSVLANSGLYSIGMDAHFAGQMLDGFMSVANWVDLAATSYPAVLRLAGDVRFYDWKKLENIDSSTLIVTAANNDNSFLKMDIGAMLTKVQTVYPENFGNILTTIDGADYAHGGIAFYGGGKNYSMLDLSLFSGVALTKYEINLNVLAVNEPQDSDLYMQGTALPLAAGTENFRFYMYDSTSSLNYASQSSALISGSAYSWITPA